MMEAERMMEDADTLTDDSTEGTPLPVSEPATRGPKRDPLGRVVVLLPALNEEEAIGGVLDRIPRAPLEAMGYAVSVWVVDGNSTDRTLEVIRDSGAKVFIQKGRGKGNGVRQAFDHLLQVSPSAKPAPQGREFFMMLDADGTYPPEDIPNFVSALEAGNEIVHGSRFRGTMADGAMTRLNAMGNRALSTLAHILYGFPVTDLCTGMWGFNAATLRRLRLVATGFDLEADLFGSACLSHVRISEMPIDYAARIGAPKLIPIRTGVQIFWRLVSRRLNEKLKPSAPAPLDSTVRRGTTA